LTGTVPPHLHKPNLKISTMSDLPFPALQRLVRCRHNGDRSVSLLGYLSDRFNYLSRVEWVEQIKAGNLSIDQESARVDQVLLPGAMLEFSPRALPEPPVSWDIQTIFEDERLLVLNKPANLPCHPAGSFFNHTLWAWLKQHKKLAEIHFCNRLDRETSGLLIIGKNPAAAKQINLALTQADARKDYLVLVQGKFPPAKKCFGWIVSDQKSAIRKKRAFFENLPSGVSTGEEAVTEFTLLSYHQKDKISLLQAVLKTGRTHQIRATLSSLGFPLVGDKLYGVNENFFLKLATAELSCEDKRQLILPRQALHAWKISFRLPGASDSLQFTAPLPQDLAAFLEKLHSQPADVFQLGASRARI
jgi:RluA family pseudouridine synthase